MKILIKTLKTSFLFMHIFYMTCTLYGNESLNTKLMKEIVFKADFDTPLSVLDRTYNLPLSGYCSGKYNKAYYFERASFNFVPAGVGNIKELNNKYFSSNGSLQILKKASPIGEKSLEFAGKKLLVGPFPIPSTIGDSRYLPEIIMASCYIKGPKDRKITIELEPSLLDKKTEQKRIKIFRNSRWVPKKNRLKLLSDLNKRETIILTGDWQRIAVYSKLDSRSLPGRRISLIIKTDNDSDISLTANGFQFEKGRYIKWGPSKESPLFPSSWMPGGGIREKGNSGINLDFGKKFPVKKGAFSFWVNIPQDSNLPWNSMGGFFNYYAFGSSGWKYPLFLISKIFYQANTRKSCRSNYNLPKNCWNHIVMNWDGKLISYYVNGKKISSSPQKEHNIKNIDYRFSFGKSVWPLSGSCNSKMDDFVLFRRPLQEDEIKYIFKRKTSIFSSKETTVLLNKKIFFRNNFDSGLPLTIISPSAQEVKLSYMLDEYTGENTKIKLKKGQNKFNIKFLPRLYKAGTYRLCLMIESSSGKPLFKKREKIEIKRFLRRDVVKFLSWDRISPDYVKKLGLNQRMAVDSHEMQQLLDHKLLGTWYFRNNNMLTAYNYNIEKIAQTAIPQIMEMKKYFNWTSTLLNTEVVNRNNINILRTNKALFNKAKASLGFTPPLKKIKTSPMRYSAIVNKNGILAPDNALKTINWYENEGMQIIQLNRATVQKFKKYAPNNILWSEPSNRAGAGWFKYFDIISDWEYTVSNSEVLAELKNHYSMVRASGKFYQPTMTMYYFINYVLKASYNGKKLILAKPVNDLFTKTLIAISGVPAHDIGFFKASAWLDGEKKRKIYIAEKNSAKRFKKHVKKELYPLAVLLRDIPLSQAKVALLCPASTHYSSTVPGWAYWRLKLLWSRCLAAHQIPFDVVRIDEEISVNNLSKYDYIILPMAQAVSMKTYNVLMKVSKHTKIIVDKYCSQKYPGMEVIDHKFIPSMGYEQEPFKPCSDYAEKLFQNLKPSLNVWAKGEKGGVFVFERLYGKGRYIVIVNNYRTTGEFNKYACSQEHRGLPYKPYGVKQKVKVYIKDEGNKVVYDFFKSQKLKIKRNNKRIELDLELPPGGAKVLCLYANPLEKMKIHQNGVFKCGAEGVFEIKLTDSKGKKPYGRQVVDVKITNPNGNISGESGLYQMKNGKLNIKIFFALNAAKGKWKIQVKELSSGIAQYLDFKIL